MRSRTLLALMAALVAAAPVAAQSNGYVVGPQDVLTITVWNQPDLSGKFAVEADGAFTFPLIGAVRVAGKTPRAVEAEITRRLGDGYFKNPNVTVAVEAYRSQQIFVVGEVRSPGSYPLSGRLTVMEALARAGSLSEHAGSRALVIRPASPQPPEQSPASAAMDGSGAGHGDEDGATTIPVDLDALQRGDLEGNVTLQGGDTVFVARAASIFVLGQVHRAGEYPLRGRLTVMQALSLAGGVTDRGSSRRIRIVRESGGERREFGARLGDPVQPGDTILVRERLF